MTQSKTPDRVDLAADPTACYRALKSHDARFDGRFFVGVRTTGIYCRPVCRVRLPLEKNCTFFNSAPAAEGAGFRPCLRCRPETAPGWSNTDISNQLAIAASRLIEQQLHNAPRVTEIADKLGVTDRHLRRIFEEHFGVSPVDYLQTQRLLLAKRLLTDTTMSVTDVAGAAGFGSLRRLNASMKERYALSPSALRAQSDDDQSASSPKRAVLKFTMPVRAPYDFEWICQFFASRSIESVEQAEPSSYQRVLTVNGPDGPLVGWIRFERATETSLSLTVSAGLAPAIAPVLLLARQLFDLDADPDAFLPALGNIAQKHPGIRVPGAVSGFEIAVRAVLGQQVTVKAARTLAARFVTRFGQPCKFEDQPGLTRAFPTPEKIARVRQSSIGELGIISRRAETIRTLAKAIAAGKLDLSAGAPVATTIEQLNAIPGIGDWTSQYMAMRALRWPDAFPAADYGVMKALDVKTAAKAREAAQQWSPWRAYAVMHLWASLH
jgi:AraC family transcriptional regulator of adaptative response / DNA-3-methyladenine glycosylase II